MAPVGIVVAKRRGPCTTRGIDSTGVGFMLRIIKMQLLLAVGLITACSTAQIRTDHDQAVDFSTLRTYSWSPDPPLLKGDIRLLPPEARQMIASAIDDQMVANGFTRVDDDPDCWVHYSVLLAVQMSQRAISGNFSFPNSWQIDPAFDSVGSSRQATETFEFKEGTLIISLVEPESRNLMWQSTAETEVHQERAMEKRRQRINTVVSDMFRRYPPRNR